MAPASTFLSTIYQQVINMATKYILKKGNKVYKDLLGRSVFDSFEDAAECNYEILNNEYEIVEIEYKK